MLKRHLRYPMVAMLAFVAACADTSGPGPAMSAKAASESPLSGAGAVPTPFAFVDGAPPLTTYDTSFAVVQGYSSTNGIFYATSPAGKALKPFLVLSTSKDAQFVDSTGAPTPQGRPVSVFVHVDSPQIALSFGPHGSAFRYKPALLDLDLTYTNYAGGTVAVEYELDDGSWVPVPVTIDTKSKRLQVELTHFSNYRVAF